MRSTTAESAERYDVPAAVSGRRVPGTVRSAGPGVALLVLAALVACESGGGGSSSSSSPASNTGDPPVEFTATRRLIDEGESTLLRWSSPGAETVSIEPDVGPVANVGERAVSPATTTDYVLTAASGSRVNAVPLTVTVRPLAAVTLVANTLEGDAPLAVRFTPEVDSSTAINRVYWDFEGDGGDVDGGLGAGAPGFDRLARAGDYDVTGRDFVHTFETPGTYEARVRVWDVDGNQAESRVVVTVRNAAPEAFVRVTPTTGTLPVRAIFAVEATDNEGIESYEWDFDGDGVYDETTTRGQARHVYESSGNFRPGVRITDALGVATTLDPVHLQVNAVTESVPTVTVSARPVRGPAPLETTLSARVAGSSRAARWQWDFDGDGVVDSEEPNGVTTVYDVAGTFYPTLVVTAEDGSVGRDIFEVVVDTDHRLAVAGPTIDPELGEQSEVVLTVNGESEVELVVENARGETVRTLLPRARRPSGEYPTSWDGADESGTIAAPGDYYAVLRYAVDGVERVLDARTTSGAEIFYPSGWGGSCRFTETAECGVLTVSDNAIQPFADRPLEYAFTTPYNARMTAYVTVIGRENFAPATFFRSRSMAAGDYAIEWFGEGTDGRLLSRRDANGYLPAIYGLTASDNAIFLSHATELDALRAEPPIFYPAGGAAGARTSRLTFDLSRDADVLMTVDDTAVGAEVFRREFFDVPAGSGVVLEWDGRNATGDLVAPGGYRISLTAKDRYGQSALPARAMQRVRY